MKNAYLEFIESPLRNLDGTSVGKSIVKIQYKKDGKILAQKLYSFVPHSKERDILIAKIINRSLLFDKVEKGDLEPKDVVFLAGELYQFSEAGWITIFEKFYSGKYKEEQSYLNIKTTA